MPMTTKKALYLAEEFYGGDQCFDDERDDMSEAMAVLARRIRFLEQQNTDDENQRQQYETLVTEFTDAADVTPLDADSFVIEYKDGRTFLVTAEEMK